MSNVTTLYSNPIREQLELVMETIDDLGSLAIVGITKNGEVMSTWTQPDNVYTLLGAIEALKVEFMDVNIEKRG